MQRSQFEVILSIDGMSGFPIARPQPTDLFRPIARSFPSSRFPKTESRLCADWLRLGDSGKDSFAELRNDVAEFLQASLRLQSLADFD